MRIIDCIRPDKQTVMFSATFPRQMEALARKILDKPIEVMYLLRYGKTGNIQLVLQHCSIVFATNQVVNRFECG